MHRNYSVEGKIPNVATVRDERVSDETRTISPKSYIRPYRPIIQMLYGPLGKGLGRRLLKENQEVKIYIPFVAPWCHDAWIAYGLRRAAMMRRLMWEEVKPKVAKMLDLYGKIGWEWH